MSKYSPIGRVAELLARQHKDMIVDKGDLAAWCFDVIRDYGRYTGFKRETVRVAVDNGAVRLPCNTYKVLTSFPGLSNDGGYNMPSIGVVDQGRILVSSNITGMISIDILAFLVDDEGYPMIHSELENACVWYVLWKSSIDKWVSGDLSDGKYKEMESQYWFHLQKARGSMRWTTDDDMNAIVRIAQKVIRQPNYTGLG